MRNVLLTLTALLMSWFAVAQEPAQAQPPDRPGIPVVQFVFDWRAQNPPRYSVAIASDGRATYRSEPGADPNGGSAPEPYLLEWTATDATRDKVFDSAKKLNYFHGKFESNAKVAQTGVKTLTFKDSSHDNSTSYNYSENPLVRDLTHIFQSISTTAEIGRKLTHDLRFDKLGIDADLKVLQEQQHQNDALEIVSIAPVLQRIAGDSSMLRMSQQRAREILRAAGLGVTPASGTETTAQP